MHGCLSEDSDKIDQMLDACLLVCQLTCDQESFFFVPARREKERTPDRRLVQTDFNSLKKQKRLHIYVQFASFHCLFGVFPVFVFVLEILQIEEKIRYKNMHFMNFTFRILVNIHFKSLTNKFITST